MKIILPLLLYCSVFTIRLSAFCPYRSELSERMQKFYKVMDDLMLSDPSEVTKFVKSYEEKCTRFGWANSHLDKCWDSNDEAAIDRALADVTELQATFDEMLPPFLEHIEKSMAEITVDKPYQEIFNLVSACESGDIKRVKGIFGFFQQHYDPDTERKCLLAAAKQKSTNLVEVLLKHYSNVKRDIFNDAFIEALKYENIEVATRLEPKTFIEPTYYRLSDVLKDASDAALHYLFVFGSKYAKDVEFVGKSLKNAANAKNEKVVDFILKRSIHDLGKYHASSFVTACFSGSLTIAKTIQDLTGCDPAHENNSALIWASEMGHVDVLKYLLQFKAVDPSAQNNRAIKEASGAGRAEVVEILLEDERVDPNVDDNLPIFKAIAKGHIGVVRAFLKSTRYSPASIIGISLDAIFALQKHLFTRDKIWVRRCMYKLMEDSRFDPTANDYALLKTLVSEFKGYNVLSKLENSSLKMVTMMLVLHQNVDLEAVENIGYFIDTKKLLHAKRANWEAILSDKRLFYDAYQYDVLLKFCHGNKQAFDYVLNQQIEYICDKDYQFKEKNNIDLSDPNLIAFIRQLDVWGDEKRDAIIYYFKYILDPELRFHTLPLEINAKIYMEHVSKNEQHF